jgi:hypothetical protein
MNKNVLQKILWDESVVSVKDSINFENFSDFRIYMEEHLPQNSQYTRLRDFSTIIKRFFPDKIIPNLYTLVWKYYQDENLLNEIMRYQLLLSEPILADFCVNYLFKIPPGYNIDSNTFKNYTKSKLGYLSDDTSTRIGIAIDRLGFVNKNNKKITVKLVGIPKTALIILTHHIFAETPKAVTVNSILENPYWRYLGIRDPNKVIDTLKESSEYGVFAKYIVVDEIEQITTKYTINELFEKRIRI